MINTDLHTLHLRLVEKLWDNLLFFIPLDSDILEIIKESDLIKYKDLLFNRLSILDYKKGAFHYDKTEDSTKYVKKGKSLSEIIFLLLEKKNNLKDYEFSYIIDKHFEQAESSLYITNWLNSNLHFLDNLDTTTKGLFQIQFTLHKKHLEEFVRNFYPNKNHLPHNKANTFQLIEANFRDITKNIKLPPLNLKSSNSQTENSKSIVYFNELKKEKEQTNKSFKKKPLVTEEEARKMILKTVFNVIE
ncbi:hypothetical protein [Lacinutrix mariniflava]|uniref:hypothetical protein n=1 Tax=Lacinutrix mariniflava TaxID=342955 RepID=UPI0006E27903|nr:hypothetical protein [Lacinutrix mariniflava]